MSSLRRLACLVLPLVACIQFERPDGDTAGGTPGPDSGEPPPPPPKALCDPLAQDCPAGEACTIGDHEFFCVPVAVEGGAGDPCEAVSECSAGLACLTGLVLADCDTLKCCTPMCDVTDAGADCPTGEACVAVFSGPEVPVDLQDYGVCKLDE